MNGALKAVCRDEVFGVVTALSGRYSFRRTKNFQSSFWPVQSYLDNRDTLNKPIVIVIESPHIDEFRVYNVYNAKDQSPVRARPANGATGRNIVEYLPAIFEAHQISLADGKYPLILVNAIQKQCSEGKDTCISRTRNFLKLWPSHCSDFVSRLKQLDPILVINACTKGDFYIRDQHGELTSTKAFSSNFETQFKWLLQHEVKTVDDTNCTDFIFMNSLDLSGLAMFCIDWIYGKKGISIYKTSHPSSWGFRMPRLQTYNPNFIKRFKVQGT